jgi:cysteine desulfurase/selenocysteine lyase
MNESIRKDFPVLERKINGKKIIYFDNAATSLKPLSVIKEIDEYYTKGTANVHRGVHKLSEEASIKYEKAHDKVAEFFGAKKEEFVFTKNATEAINSVMYSLFTGDYFKKGDKILLTKMEHHANLVPWQLLERKGLAELDFVDLNEDFTLNLNDLEKKAGKKTKLIAVTHASNTIASINPIKEIGKIAKDNNSLFLVDGAQSAPHMEINFSKLNADFFAFAGHKMLGPSGTGGLIARKELLEKMNPFLFGGSMIHSVEFHKTTWNKIPWKFEAGTPNISGMIGLGKAAEYLKKIGMDKVRKHEKELTKYALEKMNEISSIKIFTPKNEEKQVGIILFEAKGIEAHDLAIAIDEYANIAIRSGMHCAEPLISSLNPKGLDRASFYLYNTKEEIDEFINALNTIVKSFS